MPLPHLTRCQVRARAEEAFLLRNSGLCAGRFSLEAVPPFSVTPCDGRLEAGQSMQLLFSFSPESNGEFAEELAISYDTGEQCYARHAAAAPPPPLWPPSLATPA